MRLKHYPIVVFRIVLTVATMLSLDVACVADWHK